MRHRSLCLTLCLVLALISAPALLAADSETEQGPIQVEGSQQMKPQQLDTKGMKELPEGTTVGQASAPTRIGVCAATCSLEITVGSGGQMTIQPDCSFYGVGDDELDLLNACFSACESACGEAIGEFIDN